MRSSPWPRTFFFTLPPRVTAEGLSQGTLTPQHSALGSVAPRGAGGILSAVAPLLTTIVMAA